MYKYTILAFKTSMLTLVFSTFSVLMVLNVLTLGNLIKSLYLLFEVYFNCL